MPQLRGGAFAYKNGVLHCEEVNLAEIEKLVENVGTPCHVYSRKQLLDNIRSYKAAFANMSHRIGFSIKSNYNPNILQIVREEGLSAVTVSGNEIKMALQVGFKGDKIFFNGNGKQDWEIKLAIANSCTINVDSVFDAENICKLALGQEKVVQVLIRLNPSQALSVHPHLNTGAATSKFGIGPEDLDQTLKTIKQNPRVIIVGIHVHLGSTIQDMSVYTTIHEFIKMTLARNHDNLMHVKIINVGGGLDIDYTHKSKTCPKPADLAKALPGEPEFQLMVEPGRSLIATAGVLLTKVLGHKNSPSGDNLVVVDGSMTDLIRPALYSATHLVVPVVDGTEDKKLVSVVGPVCESADCLAHKVELGGGYMAKDLLAVMDTGAYGASMSSNYNMRPRAAEVLVNGKEVTLIATRQSFEDMVSCFDVKKDNKDKTENTDMKVKTENREQLDKTEKNEKNEMTENTEITEKQDEPEKKYLEEDPEKVEEVEP